jgi:uncharacterized SAM-binding protein YcdF (DUF218 family)
MAGAALWLWFRPSSPTARRCLITCATCYALASSHAVGTALEQRLGAGFSPLDRSAVPAGLTAVVVLGSGGYTTRGWDGTPLSVLDPWAASRILEAARVFRLVDPAWILVSGGLPDRRGHDEPTDVMMQRALAGLGVPSERIRTDTRSRDTRAEAAALAPILRSLGATNTILVTSRVHMRRAVGTFRAQGVSVMPAPAPDRQIHLPWPMPFIPTEAGLSATATAAHEAAGIAYYALRGWYKGAP